MQSFEKIDVLPNKLLWTMNQIITSTWSMYKPSTESLPVRPTTFLIIGPWQAFWLDLDCSILFKGILAYPLGVSISLLLYQCSLVISLSSVKSLRRKSLSSSHVLKISSFSVRSSSLRVRKSEQSRASDKDPVLLRVLPR